jgi:hypothetical protein
LVHEGHDAVDVALTDTSVGDGMDPPIAAIAISAKGDVEFVSPRALELLATAGMSKDAARFSDWTEADPIEILTAAESDWVDVQARSARVG